MKKKGFTLIELIVVIAIIGVLAAILVPAMLGYVKKSKITTANTTAKSIYNAFNSALTDLDSDDWKITAIATSESYFSDAGTNAGYTDTKPAGATHKTVASDVKAMCRYKVNSYFSDIKKVTNFSFAIKNGGCIGVGVMSGAYPGSYPHAMTVEAYNDDTWDVGTALTFALDTTATSKGTAKTCTGF